MNRSDRRAWLVFVIVSVVALVTVVVGGVPWLLFVQAGALIAALVPRAR